MMWNINRSENEKKSDRASESLVELLLGSTFNVIVTWVLRGACTSSFDSLRSSHLCFASVGT